MVLKVEGLVVPLSLWLRSTKVLQHLQFSQKRNPASLWCGRPALAVTDVGFEALFDHTQVGRSQTQNNVRFFGKYTAKSVAGIRQQ
jgi:hypothetical protein